MDSVTISDDSKTIVSGSYDGKIKFWHTETGENFKTIDAVKSVKLFSYKILFDINFHITLYYTKNLLVFLIFFGHLVYII